MFDLFYSTANPQPASKAFTVGLPLDAAFFGFNAGNPSQSLLFCVNEGESSVLTFIVDVNNLGTGVVQGADKTFATGFNPLDVFFWYNPGNPAQSLLFSADQGSNQISAFVVDPNNLDGQNISFANKTFTTGQWPLSVFFAFNPANPSQSLLFSANAADGFISAFIVDANNLGSGNVSTPNKTFTTGEWPTSVFFSYNPANPAHSLLFSSDAEDNQVSAFIVDANNLGSGNVSTPNKTFTTGEWPTSVFFWLNTANPAQSLLFSADQLSDQISAFIVDANNLGSGNVNIPDKTFTTGEWPTSVFFSYNPINPSQSLLFSADNRSNQVSAFIVDANNLGSGNVNIPDKTFTTGQRPSSVFFWLNSSNPTQSLLFTTDPRSDQISAFTPGSARNTIDVPFVSAIQPLISFSGSAVFVSGSVTAFKLFSFFSLRQEGTVESTLAGTIDYVQTADSEFTLNLPLVFQSTGAVTGFYRLTMGANQSVTLGSRSLYDDTITIPGTGTLFLTQSTAIDDNFVLSAGTTVARAPGVTTPVSLTIPYANPGLVVGEGVTLQAPQSTISFNVTFRGAAAPASYEWWLYIDNPAAGVLGNTELAGQENETSTSLSFSHSLAGTNVIFQLIANGFKEVILPITLAASNQAFPIFVDADPNL